MHAPNRHRLGKLSHAIFRMHSGTLCNNFPTTTHLNGQMCLETRRHLVHFCVCRCCSYAENEFASLYNGVLDRFCSTHTHTHSRARQFAHANFSLIMQSGVEELCGQMCAHILRSLVGVLFVHIFWFACAIQRDAMRTRSRTPHHILNAFLLKRASVCNCKRLRMLCVCTRCVCVCVC